MGAQACSCCQSSTILSSSKIDAGHPALGREKRILQFGAQDSIEDVYSLDTSHSGTIARSAAGSVFKARHKLDKTLVAVKQLAKKSFKGDWWVEEVELLKKLDHPHICNIHELWEDSQHVYLVMELCQGGDLTSLCQKHVTHLSEATAAILARQMVGAVDHFHSCGTKSRPFVHTDIRLENWLFSKPMVQSTSAADMCLKMIDFGLAFRHALVKGRHHKHHNSSGDEPEKLVQKRMDVKESRSAFCRAPEQITDKQYERLHPGMDVWALGVISFFLLAGKSPFPRVQGNLNCERVIKGEFAFEPESTWKAVSSSAKDFVAKCLQVDPAVRPSAIELLNTPWMLEAKKCFDKQLQKPLPSPVHSARGVGGASGGPNLDKPLPSATDLVKAFTHMQTLNQLEKVAIIAAAHRLPGGKIDHLRQTFEKMDKNGDGVLSALELYEGLKESGVEEKQLLEILKDVDSDGSGTIEYTEFIAAAWDFQRTLQHGIVWSVFKIFDADGSGTVSKKEILQLLGSNESSRDSLKEQFPDTLQDAVDALDKDKDGTIDFEEFKTLLNQGKHGPK